MYAGTMAKNIDWPTFIQGESRLLTIAIEAAVKSKNADVLAAIFPKSGYKNIRWLVNQAVYNGDARSLRILLADSNFAAVRLLEFFRRADERLAVGGEFTLHDYIRVCSALIERCPLSKARLPRLMSLEGNLVFVSLLTDLQRQKAQTLQREILANLRFRETLSNLLEGGFFTEPWLAMAEAVRDEKPLSEKQWKRIFGSEGAPAILARSTAWYYCRQRLTAEKILSTVLFDNLVTKEHRARCWNEYAPQLAASAINRILGGGVISPDFFMLTWKGKPVHRYMADLVRIAKYRNSDYEAVRKFRGGYKELFEELERIYPCWKKSDNYESSKEFPCKLP